MITYSNVDWGFFIFHKATVKIKIVHTLFFFMSDVHSKLI